MLYGTAATHGSGSGGTAFALDPSSGTFSLIYTFCSQPNCDDGQAPYGNLIASKGTLYGTTYGGGSFGGGGNGGTAFAIKHP